MFLTDVGCQWFSLMSHPVESRTAQMFLLSELGGTHRLD